MAFQRPHMLFLVLTMLPLLHSCHAKAGVARPRHPPQSTNKAAEEEPYYEAVRVPVRPHPDAKMIVVEPPSPWRRSDEHRNYPHATQSETAGMNLVLMPSNFDLPRGAVRVQPSTEHVAPVVVGPSHVPSLTKTSDLISQTAYYKGDDGTYYYANDEHAAAMGSALNEASAIAHHVGGRGPLRRLNMNPAEEWKSYEPKGGRGQIFIFSVLASMTTVVGLFSARRLKRSRKFFERMFGTNMYEEANFDTVHTSPDNYTYNTFTSEGYPWRGGDLDKFDV